MSPGNEPELAGFPDIFEANFYNHCEIIIEVDMDKGLSFRVNGREDRD